MNLHLFAIPLILAGIAPAIAALPGKVDPPHDGMIKVAVVLSPGATVIDFAGPWEVFQDTMLGDPTGKHVMPFDLYTVAPEKKPLHTSGGGHGGLTITPDYTFADAPLPDIVVVGAQAGGPGLSAWLRKVHGERRLIMSVCTGAFKLAKAGLLDGKQATTHHWYFGDFSHQFPKVDLVRQVRYVQADPITFTAGGLTSGVDLALHVVAEYFGADEAQRTADYMEYQGTGWKSNHGVSVLTTPVTHTDWVGKLGSGDTIVLHVVVHGASPSFSTDVPSQHIHGADTTVEQDGGKITITFDFHAHPATFRGTVNSASSALTGTYTQDGKSTPLTLDKRTKKG